MRLFIQKIAIFIQKVKRLIAHTVLKTKELLGYKKQIEKQKEVLSLFGTIEYMDEYDYKEQRFRDKNYN